MSALHVQGVCWYVAEMYTVDDQDSVRTLDGLPRCCTGAPLPVVMRDERSGLIAYRVAEDDRQRDGSKPPRSVGSGSENELIAIVRIERPFAILFGPPNDEAFAGHPLAARGLRPYGAFEVSQSSWIRRLERMNRVHPSHRPERYAEFRHFVLSFHDSTFECVAAGLVVAEMFRGSLRQASAMMARLLYGS